MWIIQGQTDRLELGYQKKKRNHAINIRAYCSCVECNINF